MDVIIQSLGFKAGETLETFTREKINNLKNDRIVRANVTLYKGPDANPENNYCEIRLEMAGNDPFVKKHGAYFETAISECIDILEEQLSRTRDKNIARRNADSAKIQDALLEGSREPGDIDSELE